MGLEKDYDPFQLPVTPTAAVILPPSFANAGDLQEALGILGDDIRVSPPKWSTRRAAAFSPTRGWTAGQIGRSSRLVGDFLAALGLELLAVLGVEGPLTASVALSRRSWESGR